MVGLCPGPEGSDLLSCRLRLQAQDHLDLSQRNPDLSERRHQASPVQLPELVPAVAGAGIDPGRRQQPQFAREAQGLRGQPRQPCELTDAHQGPDHSFVAGPTPVVTTVRPAPGSRSTARLIGRVEITPPDLQNSLLLLPRRTRSGKQRIYGRGLETGPDLDLAV